MGNLDFSVRDSDLLNAFAQRFPSAFSAKARHMPSLDCMLGLPLVFPSLIWTMDMNYT